MQTSSYKKYFVFIFIFIALIMSALLLFSREGTEDVSIGVIAPLTGGYSQVGASAKAILDYNIEKINDKYTEDKIRFSLVYKDGECDGSKATRVYEELVEEEVKFIIGGFCSAETIALGDRSESKEALVLSPTSSNHNIEGLDSYLFSFSYKDDDIASSLADLLSRDSGDIAIIKEQSNFNNGLVLYDQLDEEIRSLGIKNRVVADAQIDKDDDDIDKVTSILLSVIEDKEPNIMFVNSDVGDPLDLMAKSLEGIEDELEDNNIQLYGHGAFLSDSFIKEAGEAIEGMVIVTGERIEGDSEFDRIIEDMQDQDIPMDVFGRYYTASTIDSMDMLTEYIVSYIKGQQEEENEEEENGIDIDVKEIRDMFIDENYEGHIGRINFQNSNFPSVSLQIYEIQGGEIVISDLEFLSDVVVEESTGDEDESDETETVEDEGEGEGNEDEGQGGESTDGSGDE